MKSKPDTQTARASMFFGVMSVYCLVAIILLFVPGVLASINSTPSNPTLNNLTYILGCLQPILSIAGVVFGIIAIKRKKTKTALNGLVLSSITLLPAVILLLTGQASFLHP